VRFVVTLDGKDADVHTLLRSRSVVIEATPSSVSVFLVDEVIATGVLEDESSRYFVGANDNRRKIPPFSIKAEPRPYIICFFSECGSIAYLQIGLIPKH